LSEATFHKRWPLCRLFGIPVRIDVSWLFLAVLVTWSLAVGYFPVAYAGLSPRIYWSMGVVGALGLFASIILHEVSHALVARRFDLQIDGITLFVFGGVAEMADEPKTAKGEFLMAAAGPIASAGLSIAFLLLTVLLEAQAWPVPLIGVIAYLAMINGVLAVFNLVPAFPMDGGRILRAFLWYRRGDLVDATRVASRAGDGLGLIMIGLGVFSVLSGQVIGGIWWALIGLFVRQAARQSYQQVQMRRLFAGHSVRLYMTEPVVSVPWETRIGSFIQDTLLHQHHDLYPVVRDGRLAGYILTRDVMALPIETRDISAIDRIVHPLSDEMTIAPDAAVLDALAKMRRGGNSRLLVVADDRLVGIVTLKDLLDFFSLKVGLGELK